MIFTLVIGLTFFAYLIGAIPTSIIIGKIFYGIDIRKHGSGSMGATNTFRVLGKKAGIPVLIIDVLKGWLAVHLTYLLKHVDNGTDLFIIYQLIFGFTASIGHIYPVYVGFKGGKGVATFLGAVFAIHPWSAFIALVLFLLVLIITNYVSLGSLIGGISFPLNIFFIFNENSLALKLFSIFVAVLLFYTHRQNIIRLFNNTENKIYLFKKQ